MNTPIPSLPAPSLRSTHRSGMNLSRWGNPSGHFIWLALLVGLISFLAATPSARADQDPIGCTGSGLGILLFTDASDVHVGDTLNYSITVFNGTGNGPIVCDATSITASVITPDGVLHQIPLTVTNLVSGQSDYYTNVASYVVRAQDIQPNGTVDATASDTGVIHQNVVNSEGGGNQGVNTIVSKPCINIFAHCSGSIGETGVITITGTVTNCGNDTLLGVTVSNLVNGAEYLMATFPTLTNGQTATFTTSYVPATPCSPSIATLTAQGSDAYTTHPQTVTSSFSTTCSDVLSPALAVTKLCPVAPVAPGQVLTFSGTVTNTGNVTLNNVVVVDNQPAANTAVFTVATLAPGAGASFTGSYLAPTNCSVTDTLTATATSSCGANVANAASATCPITTTPGIAVTENCPASPALAGAVLTYTGTVMNTGDIPLTNVVVLNNLNGASPVFSIASLAPNATANFSGSYLAPVACFSANTLTASGRSLCGVAITNTVSASCPVITTPLLKITQTCPAIPTVAGGLLTFGGTVTNTGNITLTNVEVLNSLSGSSPIFTVASLAPGTGAGFTGSYVAPTGCSATSTSTAIGESICGVDVTNSVTSTCALSTSPALAITQTCPASPTAPGDVLTYSGTITNTGNVTLTNIVVLNNLSGSTPVFAIATLAPGVGSAFSGSYLTPTNCSTTSTSTATGHALCGGSVSVSASSTCAIATAPVLTMTQNCPASPTVPGALLTYTGTVTNTGNITITNIVILNDLTGSTPVYKAALLAPGAGARFGGSYLTPTNCSTTSTSTANGTSVCGAAVTTSASSTCTILTLPALKITQTCPAIPAVPGGLLTFTGTVTNSGNITLTNVMIVNNLGGTIFTIDALAPGAGSAFTGSYVAPVACSVTSTSIATGESVCGIDVTNQTSSTCAILTVPAITITQSCLGNSVAPGGVFTYTGSVSNSGNITLTNVVVLNNLSGSTAIFTVPSLDPGVVANYTGSYLAPTNCATTSTSTASARSVCGIAVANAVTTTCALITAPILNITQNCPANSTVPGALLTYSGTVTNAGNIALTNVVVLNDQTGATPIFRAATLAPGAGARFTGSYLTPTNCSTTSTSTASGESVCGITVTNTASSTCTILTTPALKITQGCPALSVSPGGLLTYSGTVTNTGNITLNNVLVLNNQSGPTPIFMAATLAPGMGATFTGSYLAPASCSVASTSIASGESVCGVDVTNSVTSSCTIITTPAVVLTQLCPTNPAIPGSLLTYSVSLGNAGNITLTNVVVVNNLSGVILTVGVLAPGVTTNFTGSYLTPTNCATTSTSTVTGRSICGGAVTATSSSTCPILTTPSLVVTESCPVAPVYPGGLLTFTGSVSNSGNITLTNVIVVSSRPVANTKVFSATTLAPGATANFSGSYTTPLNCCVVVNSLLASGQSCAGVTVTYEDTHTCIIATTPQIVVTKTCTAGLLAPGDLLTYSGTVSNAGNITLIGVTVVDAQSPNTSPLPGSIDLAPGESVSFYGSYIVQPDFCGSDTLSASALDVCNYLPVIDSITTTCPITTTPRIAVTKNCPLEPTARGGLYTYTGSVSNAGNVSLVNVYVVDDEPTNNTPVVGPLTLAPGVAVNFTNSYVAPTCCCLIIDTLTARGQSYCTHSNVSATATAVCPLLTLPGIALVETCPAAPIPMGSTFVFSGYVTNTGDTVLTNVFVYGPLGSNYVVLGPIALAPGQSQNYSGTYATVFNTSAVTIAATGQETCGGTFATNEVTCSVQATPQIDPVTGLTKVSFPTANGGTYTVQYKNSLTDPTWTNLQTVPGTGGTVSITDVGVHVSRFYRVMISP